MECVSGFGMYVQDMIDVLLVCSQHDQKKKKKSFWSETVKRSLQHCMTVTSTEFWTFIMHTYRFSDRDLLLRSW